MNYDQIGFEPRLRVVGDRDDWPAAGPGWETVAPGDGSGVDVVVVSRAGPVAEMGLRGVPMLVAPVVDTPLALVDAAAGVVFVDDAPEVVAQMLRRACGVMVPGVREGGDGRALITALSLEAARIADALARLAGDEREAPVAVVDAGMVRRLIRLRRDRERYFPAEMFADPAWDMLLDLAAARLEGQRVSVSSLCMASAVPMTTALRWVRSLSEAGIFARGADPADARRTWVALSDRGHEGMMAWLGRFAGVLGG